MKKIILSGSSSGIGKAIAQKLLDLGYSVIGLARNHAKFESNHSQYFPYQVDFTQIYQAEKILKKIHHDHPSVEAIIGNAGFGKFGALEQFSLNQICDLMNVNFIGQALLIKTFLPSMKKEKNGKIILMGSESALSGARQGTIYCATKFALRGFAQSLRQECQSAGIGVTLINPGLVRTPFFETLNFSPALEPENALEADDISEAIINLLKTPSRYIVEEINIQPLKPKINHVC